MFESEKAVNVLQATLAAFTGQKWWLSHQNYSPVYPLGVLQVIGEEPMGRESKKYVDGKEVVEQLFEIDFQLSFIASRSRSLPAESRFLARRVLGMIAAGFRGSRFQGFWNTNKKAENVQADILKIGGIVNEVEADAGENIWAAMSNGRMNVVYSYSEADVPCVEEVAKLPDVDLSWTKKSPDLKF